MTRAERELRQLREREALRHGSHAPRFLKRDRLCEKICFNGLQLLKQMLGAHEMMEAVCAEMLLLAVEMLHVWFPAGGESCF